MTNRIFLKHYIFSTIFSSPLRFDSQRIGFPRRIPTRSNLSYPTLCPSPFHHACSPCSVHLLSFRGTRTRDALLQIQMGTYANGATCYYTFPYTNNVLIGPAPWPRRVRACSSPRFAEDIGYAPWKPIYRSFRVRFFSFVGWYRDGKLEYTPAARPLSPPPDFERLSAPFPNVTDGIFLPYPCFL